MYSYKAIFLDADDTLLDYPAAERAALMDCVRAFTLQGDEEAVLAAYRAHNAAMWRAHERGEVDKATLKVERFRRLADEVGWSSDGLPALMSARYLTTLSRQSQLLDGALDLVRRLAAVYPLVLVTNGIASVQRGRLADSPITPYFSDIVISEEAGAAKPDPRIFYSVLAKHGITARDVLLIGDSTSSDMPAAHNAGMDFCWYNPAGLPVPEGYTPVFIAHTLPEITTWLLASDA